MKNKIKIYWIFFLAALFACDDPYKDSTFSVYDDKPISSYLSTRPDDFSEWIEILKYTDMYNALNQSSEIFTAFVPNNKAVLKFYADKRVSSVEELGVSFARELVKYHVVRDSVTVDDFITGGMLTNQTLTDDYLEVYFGSEDDEESGINALYLNNEAHVAELAIDVANGYVYVLNDVMRPMIESVYEQMRELGKNDIMLDAMRLTGWNNVIDIIADTVKLSDGSTAIQRRYYTILAVPDEVYQANGITSAEGLASQLKAGSDYTSPDNELYKYIGYHILQANYRVRDLQSFDMEEDVCKLWETSINNTLIKITLESDGKYYFNYDAQPKDRASLLINESDVMVKNGYFHQLDNVLPVFSDFTPVRFVYDVTLHPEIASYISSNGAEGQIYQLATDPKDQYYTALPADIGCYTWEVSPLGYLCTWGAGGAVAYWTNNIGNDYLTGVVNDDALLITVGYKGYITMQTPPILPGKYKMSIYYFYGTSMKDLWDGTDKNTNGGQTTFQFTDMDVEPITRALFSSLPESKLSFYTTDIYEEIEFDTLSRHTLKITLDDPAASTNKEYRVMIDYILFEPID